MLYDVSNHRSLDRSLIRLLQKISTIRITGHFIGKSSQRASNTDRGSVSHDDVIKWKHFPRYWPFVGGIHRSPVNFPTQRPVTRSFDVSLIRVWINGWVNNGEAGDLRRHRAHYDVTVMRHGIPIRHGTRIRITGRCYSLICGFSALRGTNMDSTLMGWHRRGWHAAWCPPQ